MELNTPGGMVFPAQQISDALNDIDINNDIPIVAYINNWAISAGAMLAYSCRFIAVAKDASIGAAEPVFQGESGKMESAPEKMNSALRTDFANRAQFFDRNPLIAKAMVDKDMILVWRYGKAVELDDVNMIRRIGPNPDKVISTKGKLLTLDADESIRFGVADIALGSHKLEPITDTEKKIGCWPGNKCNLFKDTFFSKIPDVKIDAYKMDWRINFFALLVSPVMQSILFLGLMIGFYMEN